MNFVIRKNVPIPNRIGTNFGAKIALLNKMKVKDCILVSTKQIVAFRQSILRIAKLNVNKKFITRRYSRGKFGIWRIK